MGNAHVTKQTLETTNNLVELPVLEIFGERRVGLRELQSRQCAVI